ncbi:hypothetical protein L1049_021229 [Liquidambar formosana]|uniref:NB-ARC domain-containing protein n=1 Tax=Liquidambar formosana TaxID=63359 RepID=A0AAP0S8Z0_LIQFO
MKTDVEVKVDVLNNEEAWQLFTKVDVLNNEEAWQLFTKVDVLKNEEAWKLFTKNAGKVSSLEHIKPYVEAVAKECNGLPSAIITVGAAMRGKAMPELWKDALNELQRSEPYFKGIETQVYKPLKWSYDSLHGKNVKPCFLYCSLFPKDFSIKVNLHNVGWQKV